MKRCDCFDMFALINERMSLAKEDLVKWKFHLLTINFEQICQFSGGNESKRQFKKTSAEVTPKGSLLRESYPKMAEQLSMA